MRRLCGIVASSPGRSAGPRIGLAMTDSIGNREPDREGAVADNDGANSTFCDRRICHYRESRDRVCEVPTNPRVRGRGNFEASAEADRLKRTDTDGELSEEPSLLLTMELWHRGFTDLNHRAPLDPIYRAESPMGKAI